LTRDRQAIDLDKLTTPLVHLYRGELGRMTSYRLRLDTTTNWAVGTNAALLSLVLGDGVVRAGALLPVALAINAIFIWLEARRYRGFELIRARVRLLELGLYARALGSSEAPEDHDWVAQLRESLEQPRPPLSYLAAISVRLRRGYLWLIGLSYVVWGVSVWRGPGIEAAAIGPLPPLLVIVLGLALLVALLVLGFAHSAPEEG